MTVKQYIISLLEENYQISKIKTILTSEENPILITLQDGSIIEIVIEQGFCDDPQVVEFYNSSNQLVARAKGFDSVL